MKKCMRLFTPLVIASIILSYAFMPKNVVVPEALRVTVAQEAIYPQNKVVFNTAFVAPPFLGTSYLGFKEALAFKESQGNYFSVNTLGYLGKYQFGIGTLQLMGVHDATGFLNDPALQEVTFKTNLARNKWLLRRDILKFEGKRIRGVEITESGMLAAAHLAGAGNVMKYLHSYGRKDVKDAYGTSIAKYMIAFSGYDVSNVSPERNPKVNKI